MTGVGGADDPRLNHEHHRVVKGRGNVRATFTAAVAIAESKAIEAWSARKAVTGPWTAEYGPIGLEKRKTTRVHTTASNDNSRFTRRQQNMACPDYTS